MENVVWALPQFTATRGCNEWRKGLSWHFHAKFSHTYGCGHERAYHPVTCQHGEMQCLKETVSPFPGSNDIVLLVLEFFFTVSFNVDDSEPKTLSNIRLADS